MKKKILSVLMAAALMLGAAVLPTPRGVRQAPVNAYAADYADSALEDCARQVAAIVNRERAANGLTALKFSDELSIAALVRAREIQTSFSHTRPNGTSCFTAMTEKGITYRYAGENIAYGQRSPEEVMNAWMNSSGHRANILSSNFEYIGIGVEKRGSVYYWTQFFAASDKLTGTVITEGDSVQTTTVTTAAPIVTTTTRGATAPPRTTAPTTTKTTVATTVAPQTTASATTTTACTSQTARRLTLADIIKLLQQRYKINIFDLLRN